MELQTQTRHTQRRGSARPVVALAAILSLAATATIALPRPALATSGCNTTADSTSGDFTVTATDSTPIKARIILPVDNAQCSEPTAGWPMVLFMQGSSSTRCSDMAWITRTQLAQFGYATVSFNGRGFPGGAGADGCGNESAEMADTIDDSGFDAGGPNDIQDAKDVISHALSNYDIDTGNIAVLGNSYNGARTWLLAAADTRVTAIVPVAAPVRSLIGSLDDISNKSLAEPSSGLLDAYFHASAGFYGNADPSVAESLLSAVRSSYLGETLPTATRTWFEDRTILDDNATLDIVGDTTIPTFIVNGFLDDRIDPSTAVEAWQALPSGDRYLYLGACGHNAPCATNNASTLRGKVHDFLDKYLQGSSVSLGGPIFFAVPPANQASDSWTLQTASSWPPPQVAGSPLTFYLRSGGALNTTAPSTSEAADTISNPVWENSLVDLCAGTTYGTGEHKSYTTTVGAALDLKLVETSVNLYLSSSTTRLQVVADLFEVNASTGIETRVWRGVAHNVPTSRSQTAGTHVQFQFRPSGAGYTVKQGNKLRLKIASNIRGQYAPEPLPGTYSIYHTNTEPSSVTFTFAS